MPLTRKNNYYTAKMVSANKTAKSKAGKQIVIAQNSRKIYTHYVYIKKLEDIDTQNAITTLKKITLD